jgi:hypothetical protein
MGPKEIGAPGSIGNVTTCTIQGFMILSSATSSAYYNVTLALCYLLIVRYQYSDEQLRKLEPYFLWIPIGMGLLIAIAGLFLDIYNFNGDRCFIAPRPYGCTSDGSPFECEAASGFYNLWYLFTSIEILIAACFIIGCMIMMYSTTLQRERSGDRFRFSTIFTATTTTATENDDMNRQSARPFRTHRNLSQTMKAQGLWYSGAYLISFLPVLLASFIKQYWLGVMMVTIDMLGFTNAVIYIRPRFLKFRRNCPDIGIGSSLWHTLVRTRPTPSPTRRISIPRFGEEESPTSIRTSTKNSNSMSSSLRGSGIEYKDRLASGIRSIKGRLLTGPLEENKNTRDNIGAVIADKVMGIDADKKNPAKDCNKQEVYHSNKDEATIGPGVVVESKKDVGEKL